MNVETVTKILELYDMAKEVCGAYYIITPYRISLYTSPYKHFDIGDNTSTEYVICSGKMELSALDYVVVKVEAMVEDLNTIIMEQ